MIRLPRTLLSALLMASAVLYGCSDNNDSASKHPGKEAAAEKSGAEDGASVQSAEASVTVTAETVQQTAEKQDGQTVKAEDLQAIYAGVPQQVADISDASYDDGNAIGVTFSVPVDASKNIQSYFTVEKQTAANRWAVSSGSWVLSDDGSTAYFDQVEPDSTYKVSVATGVPAINGETLHTPAEKTISFGGLQASASFASNGHFLPLNLHTGLPVYALNTPEVTVNFMRVKANDLAAFINWKSHGLSERYYRLDEMEGFSDPVYEGRYHLTDDVNKRRLVNLPVQNVKALQQPGVYIAIMQRPGKFDSQLSVTYFTVTDIGMQIRTYDNHFDVYLNSLENPAEKGHTAKKLPKEKRN